MPPARCLPSTWVYPNTSEMAGGCWGSVAVAAHRELGGCVFKLTGQPWDFQVRAAGCGSVGMQLLQVALSGSCWFRTVRCLCFTSPLEFPLLRIFTTSTE